jgi:hypothetical protein
VTSGADRYHAKRAAGLSPIRTDGSRTDPETDRQATAAEEFAAVRLGGHFNAEVYENHGDGGHDFTVAGYTVEVIWLGFIRDTRRPRYSGHLIVNPHEPHRHADLYVSVCGSIERGFSLLGCARHSDLQGGHDFGYGPRLSLPTGRLRPFPKLDTVGAAAGHLPPSPPAAVSSHEQEVDSFET